MNSHDISDVMGVVDCKWSVLFPISLPRSLYPQAAPRNKQNPRMLREDLVLKIENGRKIWPKIQKAMCTFYSKNHEQNPC